jgi:hypothetical protein
LANQLTSERQSSSGHAGQVRRGRFIARQHNEIPACRKKWGDLLPREFRQTESPRKDRSRFIREDPQIPKGISFLRQAIVERPWLTSHWLALSL